MNTMPPTLASVAMQYHTALTEAVRAWDIAKSSPESWYFRTHTSFTVLPDNPDTLDVVGNPGQTVVRMFDTMAIGRYSQKILGKAHRTRPVTTGPARFDLHLLRNSIAAAGAVDITLINTNDGYAALEQLEAPYYRALFELARVFLQDRFSNHENAIPTASQYTTVLSAQVRQKALILAQAVAALPESPENSNHRNIRLAYLVKQLIRLTQFSAEELAREVVSEELAGRLLQIVNSLRFERELALIRQDFVELVKNLNPNTPAKPAFLALAKGSAAYPSPLGHFDAHVL